MTATDTPHAPTTWHDWMRDPQATVYLAQHPDCWPDAIAAMDGYVEQMLKRAKIPFEYADPLHDYDEWRWIVIGFTWEAIQRYRPEKGQPLSFLYQWVGGRLRREMSGRQPGGIHKPHYIYRMLDIPISYLEAVVGRDERGEPTTLAEFLADPHTATALDDRLWLMDVWRLLQRETPRDRLLFLGRASGINQKVLAQHVGLTHQAVSLITLRIMRKLTARGVVTGSAAGRRQARAWVG